MTPYHLGVDLGTTWTTAAVRDGDRVDVTRLGVRRPEIPSLVYVPAEGRPLVGEAAERRGATDPGRLAREFKRRIGDPVPIVLGGVPHTPHALTATVLRHVLDTVTTGRDGPPASVTLTYPANWGPYKRDLFDQAVGLAGAPTGSVRLVPEPEAAARRHATARAIAPGETVAVYDLGGGTFDTAVLRRDGDRFVLLGEPEGIEHLGGVDFDEAVLGHVLAALGSRADDLDPDDPDVITGLARLRRSCVEAKEALSFDDEVMVPVALPGLHTRVGLGRGEMEAMIGPSLSDTIVSLRRALRSAGVQPDDVSAVLLAGGSSRIPLVERLLREEFGRPVVVDPHPEHSIAMGALAELPSATAVPPVSHTPSGGPLASAAPSPFAPAASGASPVAPASSAAPVVSPAASRRSGAAPQAVAHAVPAQTSRAVPPPPSTTSLPSSPSFPPPPAPSSSSSAFPSSDDDGERAPRRRATPWLAAGAVAVLLIAGGVAATALTRDDEPDIPSAAAEPPPFPTDPMLMRIDTGGDAPPERRSNIFVTTPGSDDRRRLTTGGSDVSAKWSHDRRRIVFTRLGDGVNTAYVMNADGSGLTKLADDVSGGRITWSMDDRRLAFTRGVGGVLQVFTVEPGAEPVQLTRSADEKDDPTWMADGEHISYWVKREGARQIYALNVAEPEEPGRLIAGPDAGPVNDPAPSPDGKYVLYTRETGPGTSDIWIIGTDGSNPRRVIGHPQRDMDPAWSPDSTWFAFVRGELNRPTILVARIDGTGETLLTRGDAREGHPHWF